jgi:hypothetical protein
MTERNVIARVDLSAVVPGTAEALQELARRSATTDVPTAAQFYGVGANKAYDLVARGEWPTRVLRMGKKIRIPVADIAADLGISLGVP